MKEEGKNCEKGFWGWRGGGELVESGVKRRLCKFFVFSYQQVSSGLRRFEIIIWWGWSGRWYDFLRIKIP